MVRLSQKKVALVCFQNVDREDVWSGVRRRFLGAVTQLEDKY